MTTTVSALAQCCILALFLFTIAPERSDAQDSVAPHAGPLAKRDIVIYAPPGQYCAWPSVVRAANDDLLVLFTQTEEHLSPDGSILCVRSTDDGRTWLPADTVFSTPLDDRESGITLMRDGTIITHFWSTCHTRAYYEALPARSYESSVLDRWSRHVETDAYRSHADKQGPWQMVSRDHGRTWSVPVPGKDAVHGGIQLLDGTLLAASYRQDRGSLGVYASSGPDSAYRWIATVQSPQPESLAFGEPHILQLSSGRIIMIIRATAIPYDDTNPRCFLWETYSDDCGRNWVPPFSTPLWGFPPHLLHLSDGRVLCTYGYRRPPFGQRACTSADGIAWDPKDEIVLRDDAPNGDLGYPASVELRGGEILTVYYQPPVAPGTTQQMRPPDPTRTKPAILGTIWSVRTSPNAGAP